MFFLFFEKWAHKRLLFFLEAIIIVHIYVSIYLDIIVRGADFC